MKKSYTHRTYHKDDFQGKQQWQRRSGDNEQHGRFYQHYLSGYRVQPDENKYFMSKSVNKVEKKITKPSSQQSMNESRKQSNKNYATTSDNRINFRGKCSPLNEIDINASFPEKNNMNINGEFSSKNQNVGAHAKSRKQGIKNYVEKSGNHMSYTDKYSVNEIDNTAGITESRCNSNIIINGKFPSTNQNIDSHSKKQSIKSYGEKSGNHINFADKCSLNENHISAPISKNKSSKNVHGNSLSTNQNVDAYSKSREQNIKNHDSHGNFIDKCTPLLNVTDINLPFPENRNSSNIDVIVDSTSTNKKIHNAHSESKKPGTKNVSEKPSNRVNLKESIPLKDVDIKTVLSEASSNNNLTNVNKDSISLNQVKNNVYSETENSPLQPQNYIATSTASNQLSGVNKQYTKCDQQSASIHSNDLSAGSVHEDQKAESKKNIMISGSQEIPFDKTYQDNMFSRYELVDLLHYNVNFMQSEQLSHYAHSLKCRILEKVHEFKNPEKDELEFLCALTDGTQTEKNQRLISERTSCIVNRILKRPYVTDCPTILHPIQTSNFSFAHAPPTLNFPAENSSQILHFPASNPQIPDSSMLNSQVPGFPASNPQISDSSMLNSQVPSFPASNPPPVPGFIVLNPPPLPNIVTSNAPQMANYFSNYYGMKVYEKATNSNLPMEPDTQFNRLPEYSNDQNVTLNKNVHYDRKFDAHTENTNIYNAHTYDGHKNNAADSSVTNTMQNSFGVEDSPAQSCQPNIAEKSVPVHTLQTHESCSFSDFRLDNLLQYNVNTMTGHLVRNYAFSMKERILENLQSFKMSVREKLKFLCEITDGSQTESNQKLIVSRMCHLILNQ